VEAAESDAAAGFDSVADSVAAFCESNSIGPRSLGCSDSFVGGFGFTVGAVADADAVISGWAGLVLVSSRSSVAGRVTSGSADGSPESTCGVSRLADGDADMADAVTIGGAGSGGPPTP
jgi:hypothetical protein